MKLSELNVSSDSAESDTNFFIRVIKLNEDPKTIFHYYSNYPDNSGLYYFQGNTGFSIENQPTPLKLDPEQK